MMQSKPAFLRSRWISSSRLGNAGWVLGLRIYYWLKPALPLRLRLILRRWWAKQQLAAYGEQWPILDIAKEAPKKWLGWPEEKEFAFVLTHDVESQLGLDRVRALAEAEMAAGFRSSFNFIPEGPYQVPPELRQWLVERGFEVGVHDHRHDGWLYQSRSHFLASATRINHFLEDWRAEGFRAGFMFHNLEWHKHLKMGYDSSTFDTDPFEPQPDGVKTIFPFWVPSQAGEGYMELPYTLVQDSTLFIMLQKKSNDIWKRKLEWIAKHGGMGLLIVHPDYVCFNGRQAPDEYPLSHYTEFLGWVKQTYEGKYWHKLPREIAAYCRPAPPGNPTHAGFPRAATTCA
jgi:hypothetical protein